MKCPLHFTNSPHNPSTKTGEMINNCFLLLQMHAYNLKQITLAKRYPLQIVAFMDSIDGYFHFEEEWGYIQHPG